MNINFKNGVSPQIVEAMLGEVMASMVFHGEFQGVDQGDCVCTSDAINEITLTVTDILNREYKKQFAHLAAVV